MLLGVASHYFYTLALKNMNPPLAPTFKVVHHVFFWLKNPDSEQDKQELITGIKTLGEIETVQHFHIGLPASTEIREVVDNSYSVTEMLIFENEADEAIYQGHDIHKAFVEKCAHLWDRVVVFDSRSI